MPAHLSAISSLLLVCKTTSHGTYLNQPRSQPVQSLLLQWGLIKCQSSVRLGLCEFHKLCGKRLASILAFCNWELWATLALSLWSSHSLKRSGSAGYPSIHVHISENIVVMIVTSQMLWNAQWTVFEEFQRDVNCIKNKSTPQQSSYLSTTRKVGI